MVVVWVDAFSDSLISAGVADAYVTGAVLASVRVDTGVQAPALSPAVVGGLAGYSPGSPGCGHRPALNPDTTARPGECPTSDDGADTHMEHAASGRVLGCDGAWLLSG